MRTIKTYARIYWPAILAILLIAPLAAAFRQDTRRQSPREQLLENADQIETIATAIGRRTRSEEIKRGVSAILDQVRLMRNTLGAEPGVPPGGGGTTPPPPPPSTGANGGLTPPPAGTWPANDADVGAQGPLTFQQSSWGFNIPGALPLVATGLNLTTVNGNTVCNTNYGGAGGPVVWTNMRIAGTPDPDGINRKRWGFRVYDVEDWHFTNCTIEDIPDEHAWYGDSLGGFVFERCLIRNIGSQAVQNVGAIQGSKRAHETAHLGDWQTYTDALKWDWQIIRECRLLEVGLPSGGRPSYALSFFEDMKNPVRVERTYIETKNAFHPDTGGTLRDSFGALFAHGRLRVELLESAFIYRNGDRDTIQLWGIGDGDPETIDITIRGCDVRGRGVDIRVPAEDPDSCQIWIDYDNIGDAKVTVSTMQWYAWPVKTEKIVYQGPITKQWDNLP